MTNVLENSIFESYIHVCQILFMIDFFLDVIDVVKDTVDCPPEEDPTLYMSEKTGRGPLRANWLEEFYSVSDFEK